MNKLSPNFKITTIEKIIHIGLEGFLYRGGIWFKDNASVSRYASTLDNTTHFEHYIKNGFGSTEKARCLVGFYYRGIWG